MNCQKSSRPNLRERGKSLHRTSELDLGFEPLERRRLLAGVIVNSALDVVNATDLSSISALISDDGGDGVSLREALQAANNTSGSDTITFEASVFNGESNDVIRLQLGQLVISDAVEIDAGTQGVVISADSNANDMLVPGTFVTDVTASNTAGVLADNNGRIIEVTAPANTEVQLTGLTITGGNMEGSGGGITNTAATLVIANSSVSGNRSTGSGGGIFNNGELTLTNTRVAGNSASSSGGGVYNSGVGVISVITSTFDANSTGRSGEGGGLSNYGTAHVERSTFVNNSTAYGAALYTRGALTVGNSTLSSNDARALGGAVYVFSSGSAAIDHSTLAYNSANVGGGVLNNGGNVSINNTILVRGARGENCFRSGGGANNLSDDNSCASATQSSTINLGQLQDNGGLTFTHALLPGSAAIDAGDPTIAPGTDQRGGNRVEGARVDVGAFETPTQAVQAVDNSLYVYGTDNRDDIKIRLAGSQIRIQSRLNIGTPDRINDIQRFDSERLDRIVIDLHGDRDVAHVAGNVAIATTVRGGAGNDRLLGGGGSNTLIGDDGNDLLRGGRGQDVLVGGTGNDRLLGLAGSDALSGMSGDDVLIGGAHADLLIGGADSDRLVGGAGNDYLIGHEIANEANSASLWIGFNEWLGNRTTIPSSLGSMTIDGVADRLIGGAGDDLFATDDSDVV